MARDHGRILSSAWDDDDLTALTESCQAVYWTLISAAGINYAGVVPITLRRWSTFAADRTVETLTQTLTVLADRHFIVVDWDTEEILVRSLMRNDRIAKQPYVFRSALKSAHQVRSRRIRAALALELVRLHHFVRPQEHELFRVTVAALDPSALTELHEQSRAAHPSTAGRAPAAPSTTEGLPEGSPEALGEGEGVTYPTTSPSTSSHLRSAHRPSGHTRPRGTRIPENFTATPAMIDWARENTPLVGAAETEQFRDYWEAASGASATKLDWVKTWRVWMRRAQQEAERFHNRRAPSSTSTRTGSQRVDKAMSALDPDDPYLATLDTTPARLRLVEGGRS